MGASEPLKNQIPPILLKCTPYILSTKLSQIPRISDAFDYCKPPPGSSKPRGFTCFSYSFDRENHEALISNLRQLDIGGPFLSILIEFLTNRLQQVVVGGQSDEYINVVSSVPQGSVLGPLLFLLYTHNMWLGLENLLVSYVDDGTLLARVLHPNVTSDVTESLSRDLSKISTWCSLWGMRLNPIKTQDMIIISRSRTIFLPHPDLFIGNISLNSCDSFRILGIMFDSKFTFKKQIRSIGCSKDWST